MHMFAYAILKLGAKFKSGVQFINFQKALLISGTYIQHRPTAFSLSARCTQREKILS